MATKTRNMSAAPADRLAERIETAIESPRSRKELAAALARAVEDDAAELADAQKAAADADAAVAAHEYQRLLNARAVARTRLDGLMLTPNRREGGIRNRLREMWTDAEAEALELYQADLTQEIDAVRKIDYAGRPQRAKSGAERIDALVNAQRCADEVRYSAEPIEEIKRRRAALNLPVKPREMVRLERRQIVFADEPLQFA